jgi:hypothetical protein
MKKAARLTGGLLTSKAKPGETMRSVVLFVLLIAGRLNPRGRHRGYDLSDAPMVPMPLSGGPGPAISKCYRIGASSSSR